ncbi:methyltransferase family protein [Nonomuraea longicatena]|uniref:Isoprenylcysteine carboxylmethyltransferase family protein n=1 Tax=Nonomuraea longicatena TaxID=83682 RepID=A0ABP4A8V5_9ACTN
MSATLIRGLGLFVPILAVAVAVVVASGSAARPPGSVDRSAFRNRADTGGPVGRADHGARAPEGGSRIDGRRIGAAVLATAWNLLALVPVNLAGWWTFDVQGAAIAGLPVDLMLGWALLWGALPALAAPLAPIPLTAAALAWLDLAVMPLAHPVVRLGEDWLLGETVAVAVALVPGLLLTRWTVASTRLPLRALFQIVLAAGYGLAAPVAWTGLWERPAWALALIAQLLAVPSALGLAAVREFAARGGGTPFPYDPPRRLVTGGPYAYVRNPMQVAMTACYLVMAVLDVRLLAAAAVAVAYGAGLAAWHEGEQLSRAHGRSWHRYRSRVRAWLPRLRPETPHATVYVDLSCGMCTEVGSWIGAKRPVALTVADAADLPEMPRRLTYEREDGARAAGVAALAHVLTHIHLGWALLGWLLLVPGVTGFAQLCTDAFSPTRAPARRPRRSRRGT